MLNIFSWRWSQLLKRSAVKRVLTHSAQIYFLAVLETLFLAILAPSAFLAANLQIFWYLIIGLLIFDILMVICTSDQYYEIKSGSQVKYRIYLYTETMYSKTKPIEMVVLNPQKEYLIREKISDHQFYQWSNWSSFIYCLEENHQWFYVSTLDDILKLGYRISNNVYFIPKKKEQIIVLDNRGTMVITADAFFLNGVFLPPIAREHIMDADTEEQVQAPHDYLITKHSKNYVVYGIYGYTDGADAPHCRILNISTVIFKEGGQEVILRWNDNYGYREFYRTQKSVKRDISDTFVELTYQNGIGGTVKKFNEETGKLDLLYKGCFRAIDFQSGAVLGDNFEFNP